MSLRRIAAPIALAIAAVSQPARADDAAAERQLRIAQRLAADRSPDAAAAFQQVVTLAPHGAFADDALVGLAKTSGAPDWPEDLGRIDAKAAASASSTLERALAEHPGGDRTSEARYRLALLRLAPLPGRDPARGRKDLIDVAGGPRDPWAARARYALGVIDERTGETERAAGEFARVLIDQPDSDAAPRARAGFGRTRLLQGRFGEAAAWLQSADDSGAPADARAGRELALAALARERAPSLRWNALATLPTKPVARGTTLIAVGPDGTLASFDRKTGALQVLGPSGPAGPPRPLDEASAIAADPYGRFWVASKEKLLRVDATALAPAGALGGFASPTAMAVDASGAVWLIDRKGDRVGRWVPGAAEPTVVHEEKGMGATAIAASGGGVVVAEEKAGRLVTIAASGSAAPIGTAAFRRPVSLAVDPAGRVTVLDEKAETLTRLSPAGEVADVLAFAATGLSHPIAVAAGPDGGVRILDGSAGAIAVAP